MHFDPEKNSARIQKFVLGCALLIMLAPGKMLWSEVGYLRILSSQPNLTIVVNDSTIQWRPLMIIALETGTYRLTVLHPQKGYWKSDDWTDSVRIVTDDTTQVRPLHDRTLVIRTIPFDAQVYLAEQYQGATPLHMTLPDSADGLLWIKKENYKPFARNIHDIHASPLQVTLEPVMNGLNSGKDRSKDGNLNKRTIALMALTVCSGVLTTYLNHQADVYYDRYLTAGKPHDMNRFYNQAKKYDRYSGISLGLFEVSFIISFYSLVR